MMQGYIRDVVSVQLGRTNHVYKLCTIVMVEICCSGKNEMEIKCNARIHTTSRDGDMLSIRREIQMENTMQK